MKIILSPSKTANWTTSPFLTDRPLLNPDKTQRLVNRLRSLSKPKLKTALKLSNSLTKEIHQRYREYPDLASYHAFPSFSGLVFKQLNNDQYDSSQWDFIAKHVRILDALHGVLEPGTRIRPYRLDMKANIGIDLYRYWAIEDVFADEPILNLASKEFSQMLECPMVTVAFLQCKNGTCKSQATYSKMGRGQMLDFIIENQITDFDRIKTFDRDGYRYDSNRSTADLFVFLRG